MSSFPAEEDLCEDLARLVRAWLGRRLPWDALQDCTQDVLLAMIAATRAGKIQDPLKIRFFAWNAARWRAIDWWRRALRTVPLEEADGMLRATDTPETALIARRRTDAALEALSSLRTRDREILDRFYLRGQSSRQICEEMGLTPTQFRLFKSRSLSRIRGSKR